MEIDDASQAGVFGAPVRAGGDPPWADRDRARGRARRVTGCGGADGKRQRPVQIVMEPPREGRTASGGGTRVDAQIGDSNRMRDYPLHPLPVVSGSATAQDTDTGESRPSPAVTRIYRTRAYVPVRHSAHGANTARHQSATPPGTKEQHHAPRCLPLPVLLLVRQKARCASLACWRERAWPRERQQETAEFEPPLPSSTER